MEIHEHLDDGRESRTKKNFSKNKKKTISIVEDIESFTRKRSNHLHAHFKHRRSQSSDRTTSSKAYSFRCALDDDMVALALRDPSLGSLSSSLIGSPACGSLNLGVRSMSFDFPSAEQISDLEAVVFAEILREAIDKLDLLSHTFRSRIESSRIQKINRLPQSQIVREKNSCDAKSEKMVFFPEYVEDYRPVIVGVAEKLLDDWNLVYNVFFKVACELKYNGSYDWLRSEINTIIDSKEKECSLEVNLKTWLDLIERLRDLLKTREEEFTIEKKEKEKTIKSINAEIDNSYCTNNEKLDYVRKWEASKLEQQNVQHSSKKESILKEIKELEKARRTDAKISEELQTHLKFMINNNEDEIATWTQRYNDELERREKEINDLQEKIDELQEFLEESRILQGQRQVVIDEYLEEQRKAQEEIDYWINVNKAATLIQAIWRGYMVRHKIGRFANLLKKRKKKKKSRSIRKKTKKK